MLDGPLREFGFQWHITDRCNLRCRHCYQEAFDARAELDVNALLAVFRKISAVLPDTAITINCTGGEPLIRSDFLGLLRGLDGFSNLQYLNIITNGLLLDDTVIETLNTVEHLHEIKISMEGGDEASNDAIRGRGTFRAACDAAIRCVRHSRARTVIMYTLGAYNYRQCRAMVNHARSLGAAGMILERFVPLGTGLGMRDQYLRPDQWRSVLEEVSRSFDLGCSAEELLPYKAFKIDLRGGDNVSGALCNLGDEAMALMPNADVYPCRRLPITIGNLRRDDFPEIRRRLAVFREEMENGRTGKCAGCPVVSCLGCRAIALAVHGVVTAEDPQCFR